MKGDKVKVSVIMPSLNVAPYMEECLQSVRNQTLHEIEILCIDAGSTDGTIDLIKKHASQDSRIRMVYSPIKSYGYQVNRGIEEANGEYVAIIETDDYITTDMLETLYHSASENDLDYVKGNYVVFENRNGHRRFSKSLMYPVGDERYNKIVCPKDNPYLPLQDYNIWRGIYKTSFIQSKSIRCNETPGAAFQDIGFLMQVLDKAKQCKYVEDCIYYYRFEREGASTCSNQVLHNVEMEFRFLFENQLIKQNKMAFIRLYSALLPEINKLLIRYDFRIKEDNLLQPYAWIKKQLEFGVEKSLIGPNDFSKSDWNRFEKIVWNLPRYAEDYSREYSLRPQKEDYLKQFSDKPLIIFGSGVYGRRLLLKLEELGARIYCVCDNSTTKVGTLLEDYEVVSPKQALDSYPDAVFVIPDRPYKTEMMNQLGKMRAEYVVMTV